MRRTLLLAAALLAIPVTAIGQQGTPPPLPAPVTPSTMTPEQMVDARQSRMGRSGGILARLKQTVDSHGDLTAFAPQIQWLNQWADEMPTLFPAGTDVAGTDARAEIWSDHAGFTAAAARFKTAAQGLTAPAAANDHAAFLTAWTAFRATCGGCHDSYKN